MLNGKRTYITETTAKVPESQVTGKLTNTNQTSNGFDVVVTNVSGGGKAVKSRVPIWSDKDGQDDLHGIMPINNQMEATRFMWIQPAIRAMLVHILCIFTIC